jgi:hypothetical protein
VRDNYLLQSVLLVVGLPANFKNFTECATAYGIGMMRKRGLRYLVWKELRSQKLL